jgi:hypothetical protein
MTVETQDMLDSQHAGTDTTTSSRFSSPLTDLPSSPPKPSLQQLPPDILLLSLPSLLAHPPNHCHYARSLLLSLSSLQRCLDIDGLSPDLEVRAWTGVAEIGIRIIDAGVSVKGDFEIEDEVKSFVMATNIFSHA